LKKKKLYQEIYFKDHYNLQREMINQTAVAANVKTTLVSNTPQEQWRSIIQDLQQNPQKVMDIIPTPRKMVSIQRFQEKQKSPKKQSKSPKIQGKSP
jgi:hypothetical protein